MKSKSTSYLLSEASALEREDRRLIQQAEIIFNIEKFILKGLFKKYEARVVDAGCANGAYLSLLKKEFSSAIFYGLDRNEELLLRARSRIKSVEFYNCDLTHGKQVNQLFSEISPDYILLRFVLQHMSRSEALKTLSNVRRSLPKGAKLIIIETDASNFETTPRSEGMQYLYDRLNLIVKSRGGNRAIGQDLAGLLEESGFSSWKHRYGDIGSTGLGWTNAANFYLPMLSFRVGAGEESFESSKLTEAQSWLKAGALSPAYRLFHRLVVSVCSV